MDANLCLCQGSRGGVAKLKGRFHKLTNHTDKREKTDKESVLTKTIDRRDQIEWSVDQYFLSFHCTVLKD